MTNIIGRPEYTDETYIAWLKEMKPFLERGKSIYKAIELAGLESKKTTIYEKYRLKDWFSEKIDAYQKVLGEVINDVVVTLIYNIEAKVKRGEVLADNEVKTLHFAAEKHRAAQPFFVNRFETAKGKPIEEIIENLDKQTDNVDDVAENIKNLQLTSNESASQTTTEQVVENHPLVQD